MKFEMAFEMEVVGLGVAAVHLRLPRCVIHLRLDRPNSQLLLAVVCPHVVNVDRQGSRLLLKVLQLQLSSQQSQLLHSEQLHLDLTQNQRCVDVPMVPALPGHAESIVVAGMDDRPHVLHVQRVGCTSNKQKMGAASKAVRV